MRVRVSLALIAVAASGAALPAAGAAAADPISQAVTSLNFPKAANLGAPLAAPLPLDRQRVVVRYQDVDNAVQAAVRTATGGVVVSEIPTLNAELLLLPSAATSTDAELAVRRVSALAGVRYAEVDATVHALADLATPERAELGLDQALQAQPALSGKGYAIAILDTGVAADNPEFTGRLYDGGDFTSGTRTPGGGLDTDGHGTGVAAVAAAAADGQGIVGAAPAADVVAYRVLDGAAGSAFAAAKAVVHLADAVAAGAPVAVANLSYGKYLRTNIDQDVFDHASRVAPDLLFVAAAGNAGSERPSYPAGFAGVLSVGATGRQADGRYYLADYSDIADVDVTAPGTVATWVGTGAQSRVGVTVGTSFSAPAIAGIATGLAGIGWTGQSAAALLKASAVDPNQSFPVPGDGSGRANALAALRLAAADVPFSTAFSADGQGVAAADPLGIDLVRFTPARLPAGPALIRTTDGTLTVVGSEGGYQLDTSPRGTLTGSLWFLKAERDGRVTVGDPDNDSDGVADGSAVNDEMDFRILPAIRAEYGQQITPGQVLTGMLAHDGAAALLAGFGARAGTRITVDGASDAEQLDFAVWAPPRDGDIASSYDMPAFDLVDQVLRTGGFTAPVSGRYVVGFTATDEEDREDGSYGLKVTYPLPTVRISAPALAGAGIPVRWAASPASGRFEVEYAVRQRSSSGWVTSGWRRWLPQTGATSATFGAPAPERVTPGATYLFRARSIELGNTGPWSAASATTIPFDDRVAARGGSWQQRAGAFLGGSIAQSSTAGSTLSLTATGPRLRIVGNRCSSCGQFSVLVDGRVTATVDSRGAAASQQVLWDSGALNLSGRKVAVRVAGTAGRPVVAVDAFAVTG